MGLLYEEKTEIIIKAFYDVYYKLGYDFWKGSMSMRSLLSWKKMASLLKDKNRSKYIMRGY